MVAQTVFDFKEYINSRRLLIEEHLQEYLAEDDPAALWEAMRYSVLSGGKRLRALLCLASAEAVAGLPLASGSRPTRDEADGSETIVCPSTILEIVLPCACAIELVHAMSLIHDDLPAMDNDDFRRGKPTNHKVFGEALALLAGDGLNSLATEILIDKTPATVTSETLLEVVKELAKAVGPRGMVGGQVDDMRFTGLAESEKEHTALGALEAMHSRKTGALIRFSAWSGARLAGATKQQLVSIDCFGAILGLAFQITDDLLDVTGDINSLGKTPGKDVAANKITWVSLFGIEQSRKKVDNLEKEGLRALEQLGLPDNRLIALKAILQYAIRRKN